MADTADSKSVALAYGFKSHAHHQNINKGDVCMNEKKDSLGDRMKNYENITRNYLMKRTPVIIRLDGKTFHTFTKGFSKPFDYILIQSMQETMKYLCENIQGCVLGYTQSDEITLVLIDYKKLDSCSWFDYNIQKCSSIAASMATFAFNRYFNDFVSEFIRKHKNADMDKQTQKYMISLKASIIHGAMFDARCFNVPKEEVCNNIFWRQNDASRNSIQMVGQFFFTQGQLHQKTCNEIQDMLMTEKNVNWNNYPTYLKRGSCCIRIEDKINHHKWIIDTEIPIFKGEGRKYIEDLVFVGK